MVRGTELFCLFSKVIYLTDPLDEHTNFLQTFCAIFPIDCNRLVGYNDSYNFLCFFLCSIADAFLVIATNNDIFAAPLIVLHSGDLIFSFLLTVHGQ